MTALRLGTIIAIFVVAAVATVSALTGWAYILYLCVRALQKYVST